MSAADFDVTAIRGEYRVHKEGRRNDRSHGTFSRAEAAAMRLAEANPGSTFIITREVARVHARRSASGVPITRRKA